MVMGDFNADPDAGIGTNVETSRLLEDKKIIFKKPEQDTFLEGGGLEPPLEEKPGLLRAKLDYILLSREHFRLKEFGVFAPRGTSWWPVARSASDHFFVWADCELI